MKKTTKKKTATRKVYVKPGVYTLKAASQKLGLALSTLRSLIETHELEGLCTQYHFGEERSSLVIESKNIDKIRRKCIDLYVRARELRLASAGGGAAKSADRLSRIEIIVKPTK